MNELRITGDWIDRYNENELSDEERAVFERRLATDPRLQEEVALDQALERFLQDAELQDLLNKTANLRNRRPRGRPGRNFLLLAASLALLAGACGVLSRIAVERRQSPVRSSEHDFCTVAGPVGLRKPPDTLECDPWSGLSGHSRYRQMDMGSGDDAVALADAPDLLSPPLNTLWRSGEPLSFSWRGGSVEPLMTVTVSDNRGREIRSVQGCRGDSCQIGTQGLPDGLYTWRIAEGRRVVLHGRLLLVGRMRT